MYETIIDCLEKNYNKTNITLYQAIHNTLNEHNKHEIIDEFLRSIGYYTYQYKFNLLGNFTSREIDVITLLTGVSKDLTNDDKYISFPTKSFVQHLSNNNCIPYNYIITKQTRDLIRKLHLEKDIEVGWNIGMFLIDNYHLDHRDLVELFRDKYYTDYQLIKLL